MDDTNHLIILWSLSMLLLLETYFSYNRYVSCITVARRLTSPSRVQIFLPYTIYVLIVLLLIWCSISLLPITMLFLCIFHFLINAYFSYFFYESVRISYAQTLQKHTNMKNGSLYSEMQQQIKQIRSVFLLAASSSLTSGLLNCLLTFCGTLQFIPFGLFINSMCLFLMFTKNRMFMISMLCCKCKLLKESLSSPFEILKKRRASPWRRPSTLSKIRTNSHNAMAKIRSIVNIPSSTAVWLYSVFVIF